MSVGGVPAPVCSREMLRTSLAAVIFLLLSSCAAPILPSAIQIAQLGTTTFAGGSLETVYPQPYESVGLAARKMITDLGLQVLVDRPQKGFLYMEAIDMTDTTIAIRVKQRTASITSVRIKIGFMGDEPYSTALMGRIAANMKPEDTDPKAAPKPGAQPLQAPPPPGTKIEPSSPAPAPR